MTAMQTWPVQWLHSGPITVIVLTSLQGVVTFLGNYVGYSEGHRVGVGYSIGY